MTKRIYIALISIFAVLLVVGWTTLLNSGDKEQASLSMWSYYAGGHNAALDTYEQQTGNTYDYEGLALDNYTTKIKAAISSGDIPDIVMIDSADLGLFLNSDQFLDFDQVFANDENYQNYKQAASDSGLETGQYQGQQKAIKFDNTSSVFYYRSDLAAKCLGINSPKAMEAATKTADGYITLFEQLQASDDPVCNQMSILATSDYKRALYQFNQLFTEKNGSYTINPNYYSMLEKVKQAQDQQMVYSVYGSKKNLKQDNAENAFLGDISSINKMQEITAFNQPGKWAIAKTPLQYNANAPYFLISKDADLEQVKAFFDATYFNQDWLSENINELGIIENQQVMNEADITVVDIDEYFTNQDPRKVINESASDSDYDYRPNQYDGGVWNVLSGIETDVMRGTITNQQQLNQQLVDDLKIYYPELNIK